MQRQPATAAHLFSAAQRLKAFGPKGSRYMPCSHMPAGVTKAEVGLTCLHVHTALILCCFKAVIPARLATAGHGKGNEAHRILSNKRMLLGQIYVLDTTLQSPPHQLSSALKCEKAKLSWQSVSSRKAPSVPHLHQGRPHYANHAAWRTSGHSRGSGRH